MGDLLYQKGNLMLYRGFSFEFYIKTVAKFCILQYYSREFYNSIENLNNKSQCPNWI